MINNKFKELLENNEIKFLKEDIKEDFTGFPELTKTTVKYILIFNEIKEQDTLLTIYNFITTNDLKFKIVSHDFMNKTQGIKIILK